MQPASETLCFFKKLHDVQSLKKEDCAVNFSSAKFSLLDSLAIKDGNNRLSQNTSKELPLYAA
jgi:hypothetical protein